MLIYYIRLNNRLLSHSELPNLQDLLMLQSTALISVKRLLNSSFKPIIETINQPLMVPSLLIENRHSLLKIRYEEIPMQLKNQIRLQTLTRGLEEKTKVITLTISLVKLADFHLISKILWNSTQKRLLKIQINGSQGKVLVTLRVDISSDFQASMILSKTEKD